MKYEFLLDLRVDKDTIWKDYAGIYTLIPGSNPERNTKYSKFKNNGSIYLSGNKYLRFSSTVTLNSSNKWTISVWSYRNNLYTNYSAILADEDYNYTLQTYDSSYSDRIGCRINDSGYTIYSNTMHPINEWVHIALVNNPDNDTFSLYMNGIKQKQMSCISMQFNYIGHSNYNEFVLLDDLCIVKDVLWTKNFELPNKYLNDYLNPPQIIYYNLKTT